MFDVFPVCAGVSPQPAHPAQRTLGIPHMCGDEPDQTCIATGGVQYSPYAWG